MREAVIIDYLRTPMSRSQPNEPERDVFHPLGMTGVRLVGTLARILQIESGKYGLATACVGGGQGVATIIEST